MSVETQVSGLLTPVVTPRLAACQLPVVPSNSTDAAPMTRKQAREDRHLQYLEEERLDDERALQSITAQVVSLRGPLETVKLEFEDLDGLTHSPPSLRLIRPPPQHVDIRRSPAVPAVHHVQSLPPLTPDATIRAISSRRSHLPASFKTPGSPQLEALTRKSSRRSASAAARRRQSAERERMCRSGSSS